MDSHPFCWLHMDQSQALNLRGEAQELHYEAEGTADAGPGITASCLLSLVELDISQQSAAAHEAKFIDEDDDLSFSDLSF